jgi:4-hydroxybenzoate polyprenyltransferase/phosphoglycolate phosphatase-like HAD superfamily hydrolase
MADLSLENPTPPRPLIVDLDGTLVATDTLHELLLELAGRNPFELPRAIYSLSRGRVGFKAAMAELAQLDPAALPYRDEVLELINQAKAQGRPVVLASASHASTVESVAEHLGLFDAVISTDDRSNRKGAHKLEAIRDLLTEREWGGHFDYVGDEEPDLAIWAEAHTAYVVQAPASVRKRVRPQHETVVLVPRRGGSAWYEFMLAARPYQWSKNLLLLVPLIASQEVENWNICWSLIFAFISFSLCASAVYLVNDLLDLRADRLHPTKRNRPIAAGRLAPKHAVFGALALILGSFTLSLIALPDLFTQILAVYFVLTTAYSLYIKGKAMLDVVWLASLYTLRIIAGGAAVAIVPSEWLLGFTLFTFLSLAFVKRFCELRLMLTSGKEKATGRGYHTNDLQIVQSMGVGSGYLAVMIFALYITSDAVAEVYVTPKVLWLACPLLLYWMSRMWLFAQRGKLRGDPLLFALSDRTSYFCLALMAMVIFLAQYAY